MEEVGTATASVLLPQSKIKASVIVWNSRFFSSQHASVKLVSAITCAMHKANLIPQRFNRILPSKCMKLQHHFTFFFKGTL